LSILDSLESGMRDILRLDDSLVVA
jgi:hypothetical protein